MANIVRPILFLYKFFLKVVYNSNSEICHLLMSKDPHRNMCHNVCRKNLTNTCMKRLSFYFLNFPNYEKIHVGHREYKIQKSKSSSYY